METSGRERRHRYYTVANYYKLVSEEALDKSCACPTDIVDIGKFYAIRSDSFYENNEELVHRQDAAKDSEPMQDSEIKKHSEGKPSISNVQPKQGRPQKPPESEGKQGVKRKRKASSLTCGDADTSGSEEPLAKSSRLDGTGLNAVGMSFSSSFTSFTSNVLFSVFRGEARRVRQN